MAASTPEKLTPDQLTIDQLTAASGVPSRTIRQYQTEVLLPPPVRHGRVGHYGSAHLDRLALIARLQDRGYSLAGMRDLFAAWEAGGGLHSVLGTDAALVPVDEASVLCTEDQLLELLAPLARPALRRAAIQARLIDRVAGRPGEWRVRSPAALDLIADLVAAGARPADAIAMFQRVRDACEVMAADLGRLTAALSEGEVTELLRRHRGSISRSAATLAVGAVGDTLSDQQREAIRIGAIADRRP
ncbi:MAG: MerR family transcriptional regulator [Ilumatobacteraceae bacterium]|nr:MerR family transcriptional regulator [Ilumatobacteraceae bacterium]